MLLNKFYFDKVYIINISMKKNKFFNLKKMKKIIIRKKMLSK